MDTTRAMPARLLTAGAATFAAYVITHPHGRSEPETIEEATSSMAAGGAWVASHLIGLLAVALIAVGVALLLRSGWLGDDRRARRAGWLVVVGAGAAAIELVPHTLVALETDELVAGGSTPFTDLHLLLQSILLPLYGIGVAALAVFGFGRVAPRVMCLLGAIGGAAIAVVGPLLLMTGDPAFGAIFLLGPGTFLFLLATGLRAASAGGHRPRRKRHPTAVVGG